MQLGEHYLTDVRHRMRGVKDLGDRALAQLPEDQWHRALSPDGNSTAVLIQHLHGNMVSRWGTMTHGFTELAEGESQTRDRDREFVEGHQTPAELRAIWEDGWQIFLEALDHFTADDLLREMTIRGETHTILQAIQRQVAHYSGHVYQLIFLVKTLQGAAFETLSVARGQSAAFNAAMMGKNGV